MTDLSEYDKGGNKGKMKMRIIIGVVVALLLVSLMPGTVLAAKPVAFNAGGQVFGITEGDVHPAGESGRWIVAERDMFGFLGGSINGMFDLKYKANIESADTQEGTLHGKMVVTDMYNPTNVLYTMNVNGKSVFDGFVGVGADGYYNFQLTISGHWNFLDGARGNGTFTAVVVYYTDSELHVLGFRENSCISATGQWQP